MSKKIAGLIILIITIIGTSIVVIGANTRVKTGNMPDTNENYPYIEEMMLGSSRYTQPENYSDEMLENYHDNFTVNYTDEELEYMHFESIYENDKITAYFEKDSFSLIIKNKLTGYMWSSRAELQQEGDANRANRNLLNSGLHITYFNTSSNTLDSITEIKASLYSLAQSRANGTISGVDYLSEGDDYYDNAPENTKVYLIDEGSYNKRNVEVKLNKKNSSSFAASIDIKILGFKFDVVVEFQDTTFSVSIENSTIKESNDKYRLLNISLFPFMGSTVEDEYPAYMVVPDGTGALVRLNDMYNRTVQNRFFGSDYGYAFSEGAYLNLPIYGIVHESGKNGIYANIESGSTSSLLTMDFWGVSSKYNKMYSTFMVREIFRMMVNRTDSTQTYLENLKGDNYKVTYNILSNEEASYVGIALDYRDKLIETNDLSKKEDKTSNIPLNTAYILADVEPLFIGTNRVHMTSIDDVTNAYNNFKNEGITNQLIAFQGWSKDGGVDYAPYSFNLVESGNKFKELANMVKGDNNAIYLYNDYVYSSNYSHNVFYNTDVTRDFSKVRMDYKNSNFTGTWNVYVLNPESSIAKAGGDVNRIKDLGVNGFALEGLGHRLFSYYNGEFYHRHQTLEQYEKLASLFDDMALYAPNQYMFKHTSAYLNMSIDNGQYTYYTDLVPLLPMVLKGSIPYYSNYLNFNAYGSDYLLQMIDFSIYPSYILTQEDTAKMRYTGSAGYYSTTMSNFYDEIIENYHFINEPLKRVTGAYVTNRTVHEVGLVEVNYSNGVSIFINYNLTDKTVINNGSPVNVKAKGYMVV